MEKGLELSAALVVAASLAGDIELTTVIVLNGDQGAPVRHAMFSATFPRA